MLNDRTNGLCSYWLGSEDEHSSGSQEFSYRDVLLTV